MSPGSDDAYWVEPGTRLAYPTAYAAYRQRREAQEKRPGRHCALGPEIDRYVWRRWRRPPPSDVDVVLVFRPGVSPRVQRIVGEVVRAIGRGSPAGDAIRRVARRFGLRHAQARAFITAGIDFELRVRREAMGSLATGSWCSSLAD
jgi:hypothetical protein